MGWMQRHSCEQAARLLSMQRDEALGRLQRWQLGWHLRCCGDCRQVRDQLALLGSLGRAWRDGTGADATGRE